MTSLISSRRTKLLIFDPAILFSQSHHQFYNMYQVTSEEVLRYMIGLCPWTLLNAFEKMGKVTVSTVMSVRPSAGPPARPRGTTWLPLYGFL
jgi:hypothetical protein